MEKPIPQDPSNSAVQLGIERIMLNILCESHPNWHSLEWAKIAEDLGFPTVWQKARPDAVWQAENGIIVIAECYARIGYLKPGHRRKIAMDVLKLLSLRNAFLDQKRLRCLFIVPEELNQQLSGNDWLSEAIRQNVEIVVVKLNDEQRQQLKDAENRQALGQARLRETRRE